MYYVEKRVEISAAHNLNLSYESINQKFLMKYKIFSQKIKHFIKELVTLNLEIITITLIKVPKKIKKRNLIILSYHISSNFFNTNANVNLCFWLLQQYFHQVL